VLIAILLGITLSDLAVQVLWLNMSTASCLVCRWHSRPRQKNLMQRSPTHPDNRSPDRLLVFRSAVVASC